MLAVLRRLGEAGVGVLVDPRLVDKEVLVHLHDGCRRKRSGRGE